ncbi:MAG: hypothetical protein KME46_29035 [Brasilonema angustatum HA4187-MV1]|nr:hypothetical protein [Brasilonema angustatum HA4187-MV1]
MNKRVVATPVVSPTAVVATAAGKFPIQTDIATPMLKVAVNVHKLTVALKLALAWRRRS